MTALMIQCFISCCCLRCRGQSVLGYSPSNNRWLMHSFTAVDREQVNGELLWRQVRSLQRAVRSVNVALHWGKFKCVIMLLSSLWFGHISLALYCYTADFHWADSGLPFHQESRFLSSPTVCLQRQRNHLRLKLQTTYP